jgi:hypothetical protein
VITRFTYLQWPFEVFAAAAPVRDQIAWRHFVIERRLLAIGGDGFRRAVMLRRHQGLKTEAAFATTLNLAGEPYATLLELEGADDETFSSHLKRAGV